MAMEPVRTRALAAVGALIGVVALAYLALNAGSRTPPAPAPRAAPLAADAGSEAKADTDAAANADAAGGPAIKPAERSLPGTWVDVAAPAGTASAPVILGLHGRGDTAEHFSALASRLGGGFSWRFLQAPLPFADGRAWYRSDQPDGGRADLEAALAYIDAHVRAAAQPVALFGFSQGCFVAGHYAARHPEAVRAVVCIGGGLIYPPEPVAAQHRPPMLYLHATDDAVVPLEAARGAVKQLQSLGYSVELVEHGEGHSVPESEIERIRSWLERKLK